MSCLMSLLHDFCHYGYEMKLNLERKGENDERGEGEVSGRKAELLMNSLTISSKPDL
jgi:hypothetical protein